MLLGMWFDSFREALYFFEGDSILVGRGSTPFREGLEGKFARTCFSLRLLMLLLALA